MGAGSMSGASAADWACCSSWIYGGYFLVTYLCSRSSLSEGMEDGGAQDF